jgi:hypothetical protein
MKTFFFDFDRHTFGLLRLFLGMGHNSKIPHPHHRVDPSLLKEATMKNFIGISALLLVSSLFAASSHAGIVVSYTVNDASHLLNGATVASTTADADTWMALGPHLFAGSADTSIAISGATGAGSVWNGSYSYTGTENVGIYDVVGFMFGPAEFVDGDTVANIPIFGDGSGNQLTFRAFLFAGATPNAAGDSVIQEHFSPNFTSFFNFGSAGGSNPIWGAAGGGTGTVTVTSSVPEPTSMLMFAASGSILMIRRRRR